MLKGLFKVFIMLTVLCVSCTLYKRYVGREQCGYVNGADYLEHRIGKDIVRVPLKYYSLCISGRNAPWPSYILEVSYPDWGTLPRMNKENREDVLKRRLTITVSDNLERRRDILNVAYENRKNGLEGVSGVTNKIYPDPPKKLPNGLLHYTPKATRHVNNKDLYVQKDKAGNVIFMLECGARAVGGGYCSSDHILINDLEIDYSYDISHLDDALEIDQKIRALIESMIVKPLEASHNY